VGGLTKAQQVGRLYFPAGAVSDPTITFTPLGHPQGQATDIAIQAEEIMKLKKQLYNIYAKHTKQSLQVIGKCPA
jgi:ATP-dependent protease ClpP protease subunit